MAIPQDLQDVLTQIDDDTNKVADVVAALRAQVKAGMSQAEATAVKDKLAAVESRLRATASDPNSPVPAGPPPTP